MDQIRLTCGGCNKRYRLPGNATGYFCCRRCDLVMKIPENTPPGGAASENPASRPVPSRPAASAPAASAPANSAPASAPSAAHRQAEEQGIAEIAFDPATHQPVHLAGQSSASGVFHETGQVEQGPGFYSTVVYGAHIKRKSVLSPIDISLIVVGSGLLTGGLFVNLLQILKETEQAPSVIAPVLGLLTALTGMGVLAMGLRKFPRVTIPVTVLSGLLTLILFGVPFIPPADSVENQIAKMTPKKDSTSRDTSQNKFRGRPVEPVRRPDESDNPFESGLKRSDSRNRSSRTDRASSDRASRSGRGDEDRSPSETKGERNGKTKNENAGSRKGRSARDLDRLWKDTAPDRRHENVAEMKRLVNAGLDDAEGEDLGFWEMYDQRLKSLGTFQKGKWVNLDFTDGPAGWHVTNPDAVKIESGQSILIDNRESVQSNTIVASPDLFYGPVSIQVELTFSGGETGGPCEIGLFFASESEPGSISRDDCVVAFDASFNAMEIGTWDSIENNSTPVSLSHLARPVDLSQPVSLNVNMGTGFIQVFANGQLLIEKFDDEIPAGHCIGFSVLPQSTSGQSFQVGKCRVRQWKSGPPPGLNAFVEEDYMYYPAAAEEADGVAWLHYRKALAELGNQRIAECAASAHRAEDLGFPHEKLVLFYALEHETKKEDSRAIDAYTSSRASRSSALKSVSSGIDIHELARAYHAWFVVTHHDPQYRGNAVATGLDDHFHSEPWVVARIKAALAANRRNFGQAIRLLEVVCDDIPVRFRGEFTQQLQAYKAETAYYRSRGSKPFYHRVKIRIRPDHVYYNE